jgi:hypothetical protein
LKRPKLGRRAVALDLELLDRVDDREEGHLPGSGCSTEMPSNRYSLVRGRPPLMRGKLRVRRQRHAGASDGEHDERAAVQRQLDDLLLLDDGAEAGRSARRIGASAVTVTCSRTSPTRSSKSIAPFLPSTAGSLPRDRLEAGQLDVDAVGTRRPGSLPV